MDEPGLARTLPFHLRRGVAVPPRRATRGTDAVMIPPPRSVNLSVGPRLKR